MKNKSSISLNSMLVSQRDNKYVSESQQDPLLLFHLKIRSERKRNQKERYQSVNFKKNQDFVSLIHQSQNDLLQDQNPMSSQNLFQSEYKLQEIANQNFQDYKELMSSPHTNIPNSNSSLVRDNSTQNIIHEQSASSYQSNHNITPLQKVKLQDLKPIQYSPSKPTSNRSLKSQSMTKILPQITTRRTSLAQDIGQSLSDLKTEHLEMLAAKTERQNIFLKQQELKERMMHQELKSSINRLNNQPIVQDAHNIYGQVDTFLAGGIAFSKNLLLKDNISSLNQKLMEEGIIANTSQVSFIKKRRKKQEDVKIDSQAEELQDDKVRRISKVQIKSKNDLDSILGQQKTRERQEILSRVNKILEDKKKKKPNNQNNYNKWYIHPDFRNVQRVDRLEKLYPYAFDQNYLYNNIDNYEDLYKDNPFDKELSKKRQHINNQKQLKIENLKSMLVNSDVIREYTKQLTQNGERIPLFMKEVFDQDIGKVQARSSLLNRYYNKSSESERI